MHSHPYSSRASPKYPSPRSPDLRNLHQLNQHGEFDRVVPSHEIIVSVTNSELSIFIPKVRGVDSFNSGSGGGFRGLNVHVDGRNSIESYVRGAEFHH